MKSKVLLIVFLFLVVISCRRKSSDDYNYYKPYKGDSISSVDSTAVQKAVIDPIVEKMEEKIEIRAVDLKHSYFGVVASYTIEEFAIQQKKELIKQGYKPEIIMLNDDGWYKLAVESYATFEEAKALLPKLKSKGGMFSEARIVFKTNK